MSALATDSSPPRSRGKRRLETASYGMMFFIASEVMFFGGLLFVYLDGRIRNPAGFAAASRATDVLLGTVNTAVLLTSSFLVALAVEAGAQRRRSLVALLLAGAAALGVTFLAIKGIEYRHDWTAGLFPGPSFHLENGSAPPGAELFFMLYLTMTGVHAIHLIIGIAWLGLLAMRARQGSAVWTAAPKLEVAGLYWHFVDVFWIFLYPLLYLVSRAT